MSSTPPAARKTKKKRPCGPHVELSSNAAARITRCGCGTVHVHFLGNGITMRLPDGDALRHVANALMAASRVVDLGDEPVVTTPGDDTIN